MGLGDFGALIWRSVAQIAASLMTLTETGGTLTSSDGELNLYINNAPAGLFAPRGIFVDFTAHTGGETVKLKSYYRVTSDGGLILNTETEYAGAEDPPLVWLPLKENRYGIKVTLQKTAGAVRDYDWEAIYDI